MRIGELARRVGVSTDTVRYYERSGWLPRASREENRYRDYDETDVEHLGLLVDLRPLDVPLEHHVSDQARTLTILQPGGACCPAAGAVVDAVEGTGCACCSAAPG